MSEIAHLRERIRLECEAAWLALYGPAEGVAKHEAIMARFRIMDGYHQQLAVLVGEEAATGIVVETYNEVSSREE